MEICIRRSLSPVTSFSQSMDLSTDIPTLCSVGLFSDCESGTFSGGSSEFGALTGTKFSDAAISVRASDAKLRDTMKPYRRGKGTTGVATSIRLSCLLVDDDRRRRKVIELLELDRQHTTRTKDWTGGLDRGCQFRCTVGVKTANKAR